MPDPVIPDWLEPRVDLISLEWRPAEPERLDLARVIATYEMPAPYSPIKLVAVAPAYHEEELHHLTSEMRVWFYVPGDEDPRPPSSEPYRDPFEQLTLYELLDLMAQDGARGPRVAVEIIAPWWSVFRIDPTIMQYVSHAWKGMGDVTVAVTHDARHPYSEIKVKGLRDIPQTIIVGSSKTRATTGYITVEGLSASSNYRVDGRRGWQREKGA